MKGLRWIFAFLRDPPGALGGSIATIRGRLAPLASRIQLTVTEAVRTAARKLALGPVAASFVLGALFLSFSAVPLALLNRVSRKPISTDEPR